MLEKFLDFIEFVVCADQRRCITNELTVSLGIENIQKLWYLLAKEPNFSHD